MRFPRLLLVVGAPAVPPPAACDCR